MSTQAMHDAVERDRELAGGLDRGVLHGIPISIADNIDVSGIRTTAGSTLTEGVVAARDAAVVRSLHDSGAVLIGKTNLPECGFGATSDNSAFSAVRNPSDDTRSAGGASGGSAVSVATRMSFGSIGTDTGGSVRIAASVCGVVGLKPTRGELVTDGVVPFAPSLDHVGVLAPTVTDAFLLYNVLKGHPRRGRLFRPSLVDIRFGVLHFHFCDTLDPEIAGLFERAIMRFDGGRSRLVDCRIPGATSVPTMFSNLQAPEAHAYHAANLARWPSLYTPAVRSRLEYGASISASEYVSAQAARKELTRDVETILKDVDVLVLPTLPVPPPFLGTDDVVVDGIREPVGALMSKMTQLFNITGHPAISIPCGTTAAGMPGGLQLVGPRNRTLRLLEIARQCEAVLSKASGRRR
jgi:aspartyl-tRNA(Asn)/glutamyl-tRNA(Gln) amidotransferase subunit A